MKKVEVPKGGVQVVGDAQPTVGMEARARQPCSLKLLLRPRVFQTGPV
jgi:hypothetical protein